LTIDRQSIIDAALARYPIDPATGRHTTTPAPGAPELPLGADAAAYRVHGYAHKGAPGLRILLERDGPAGAEMASINAAGPASTFDRDWASAVAAGAEDGS